MTEENATGALSAEVIDGTFALAREGRTIELREMITAGVPVDTRNARSDTMLIVAAYAQQHDVVAELIRLGASLNIENRMGQTALSCAVFRNDEPLLRTILDAGADPNVGFHSAAQIAEQFQLDRVSAVLAEYASRG